MGNNKSSLWDRCLIFSKPTHSFSRNLTQRAAGGRFINEAQLHSQVFFCKKIELDFLYNCDEEDHLKIILWSSSNTVKLRF